MTQWRIRAHAVLLALCVVFAPSISRAEDDAAAKTGTLRGVVLGADKKPIAGATVRAWSAGYGGSVSSRADVRKCFEGAGRFTELGHATTNASGRWHIAGLEPGTHVGVVATGPAAARSRPIWGPVFQRKTSAALSGSEVVLQLRGTVALSGRLVDASGTGVAGFVTAMSRLNPAEIGKRPWASPMLTPRLATTADGRFTIHAEAGAVVQVDAFVAGLGASRGIQVTMPASDAGKTETSLDIAIRTPKGSELSGVVRDEHGKPITGAQVVAELAVRHPTHYARRTFGYARSGDDGRYLLRGLPGSLLVRLVVARDGYAMTTIPPDTGDTAGGFNLSEPALHVDITLHRGRTIAGRVLDTAGAPLESVRVVFLSDGRWVNQIQHAPTLTDAAGHFELSALPLQRGSVVAESTTHVLPSRAPTRSYGPEARPRGHRVLASAPSVIEGITIRMLLGESLFGRLVDREGRPIAAAAITLTESVFAGEMTYRRRLSDKAGEFSFHALQKSTYKRLEIDAPGFAKQIQDFKPGSAVGRPTITLARGGVITGRILDAEGLPSAGTPVQGAGMADIACTNADGIYVLRRVPPGTHTLRLANAQGQLAGPEQHVVTLSEGETIEGVGFTLPPKPKAIATESLAGILVDPDGVAVAGSKVRVQAVDAPHHEQTTQSDAEGRFEFAKLFPGRYRIYAGPLTRRPPIVKTESRDVKVVVPTFRTRILAGEVRGPDGQRIPYAIVEGHNPNDAWGVTRFRTCLFAGRFRVSVPADTTRMTLTLRDPRDASGRPLDLRYKPRQTFAIDGDLVVLTMTRAATLGGIIVDSDGQPVAGYPLRLTLPSNPHYGGYGGHKVETDPAGRFVFQGLEPRAYKIESRGLHGWSVPEARLYTAPREDIRLVVRRYKNLRGRLLDAEGDAIVGVRAWTKAESRIKGAPVPHAPGRNLFFQAHTDAEGRFTLEHLPPEFLYTVRFNLPLHLTTTHFPPILERVEAGGPEKLAQLKRGVVIEGLVVDAKGQGVSKLHVASHGPLQADGSRAAILRRSTSTDEDGHFRIGPFPADERVTLMAYVSPTQKRSGVPWLLSTVEDVSTGRADVRIVMSRGVEIRGHVAGVSAAELQGLSLSLKPADGRRSGNVSFHGKQTTFVFAGLTPGSYVLTLGGPSSSRVRLPLTVKVEAPAEKVILEAIVRMRLRGRMTGVSAKGYSARFLPHEGAPSRRSVELGLDGTFDLRTVDSRPGTLIITSPAKTHVVCLDLTPSGERLAVKAVKTKRLEGRVVGLLGKIRGSTILARRGRVTFKGSIAEDGVFTFTGLPPGEWHLEVRASSFELWTLKPKGAVRAGDLFVTIPWR